MKNYFGLIKVTQAVASGIVASVALSLSSPAPTTKAAPVVKAPVAKSMQAQRMAPLLPPSKVPALLKAEEIPHNFACYVLADQPLELQKFTMTNRVTGDKTTVHALVARMEEPSNGDGPFGKVDVIVSSADMKGHEQEALVNKKLQAGYDSEVGHQQNTTVSPALSLLKTTSLAWKTKLPPKARSKSFAGPV